MPLIRLSAICAATMALLLVLGERTLPLLGGDRAFAARLYKAVFMALIAALVGIGGAVLAVHIWRSE